MATYIHPFRLFARHPLCRIPTQRATRSSGGARWLSSSQSWRDGVEGSSQDPEFDGIEADLNDMRQVIKSRIATPTSGSRSDLEDLPPFRFPPMPKQKPGLLNMGEKPGEDSQEDPEFEDDDITSLAHGDLEQHREYRHYARLTAWEMPLLTKMAKPFVPPTEREVLRFRYTTYMGEEHPAEKKVVVEFCAEDIPDLTEVQQHKFKKLVGSRWNPKTNIIKMSSEMFENQAQNKRYLSDLVDTLLEEARDPTDTFADIPLDTRHRRVKSKPRFPVEWRITEERKAQLKAHRQQIEQTEAEKSSSGSVVDGVKQIEVAHIQAQKRANAELQPQMVPIRKAVGKRSRPKQF